MPRRLCGPSGHWGGSVALGAENSNSLLVTASNASLSFGAGSGTFAWWGRYSALAASTHVVASFAPATYNTTGWLISLLGSVIAVYPKAGANSLAANFARPDSLWHRYVVAFDASTHTIYVYRDGGFLIASAGGAWSGSFAASDILQLGGNGTSPGGNTTDAVYDVGHAWTAAQVLADYQSNIQPATVTHRWPLDDGAGSTARATLGGLPLTLSGGAAFSAGSPNKARGAVQNFCAQSAAPTTAPWVATNFSPDVGATVNGIAIPGLNEGTTGVVYHNVLQTQVALVPGSAYFLSCYVAAGTRSWIELVANAVALGVYLNASTGAFGTNAGMLDYGTESVSGGYRVWCKFTASTTTGSVGAYITTGNGAGPYAGAGGIAMSVGAWQLEEAKPGQTTPSPYVATGAAPLSVWGYRETRQNLLRQSSNLGAVWTFSLATAALDTTTAPDGTLTADTITTTAVSATGAIQAVPTRSLLLPNTTYTYQHSVRKGNSFTLVASETNGVCATFDGVTGAFLGGGSNGSGWTRVTQSCVTDPRDSNWWLATLTFTTPPAFATANASVYVLCNKNKVAAWSWVNSGSIGDTLILWGAQLVQADGPREYIATTSAPANASGAPR